VEIDAVSPELAKFSCSNCR